MSVVVGIDPSSGGSDVRQVALRKNVGSWKVLDHGGGDMAVRASQVVLSVPSDLLTFRSLTVPFTDRKRAEDVVRQELANTLPMPLSDVVWSVCPVGKHEYLAVVSPRRKLESLKASCEQAPDVIDAEPFGYARALAAQSIRDGLVIDFAAHRTTFCMVANGRPAFVRVLLRGGASAGDLKGFVDRLVADALLPDLPEGCSIFVTGIAASPAFLRHLTERLQRPAQPFPVPVGLSSEADVSALGAALRSVYPEDGVDLQRREQTSRPAWTAWIVWAAAILLLITADVGMRLRLAEMRARTYAAAIGSTLKQEDPGIAAPTLQALNKDIEDLKKQQATAGQNVLEMLRQVADKAKGKSIRIYEISFAEGRLRVRGEAPGFTQSNDYQKDLGSAFPTVEVVQNSTNLKGHISFELRLGVKP